MKIVSTKNAPEAIGPYSQAMIFENLIFTSGQIALKPNGEFLDENIEEQTKQVLENLSQVLSEAKSSLQKVLKTTIFLSDINDFTKVNEIYGSFFGSHKPARSTVAVKTLPKNAKVEIEAIAII
ncbi:MAG: RidA family protein [Campylobacteraceae bacterium]